jgi:hypothetical protein
MKQTVIYCDIFRLSAVVAKQREMKHISMDTLDTPTVLDGCGNQEWNTPMIG